MATGNKLVKEITDQFLHCKICLGPYQDPKTLVCLHTFCADCLQQHVDSDTNRSSRFLLYNRYITCPLCRRKTEIPTGGVKRLPDNFLVSNLTDVLDRKRLSKIPPCEICTGEKPRRDNNACHKCLDCAKLLCKSCVELHMTTKVTQNHSLIDIEGEKDIQCGNHPEEIVRFYCEPCDECICVVCTFQEHRDHEICSFSDGFNKYKSGLDGLLAQCKDRLVEVQGKLISINKIESTLKETRENIRDLAISYISQVRSTERQLMQRVDQEFGDKVLGFLQNKEWLQENFENLQSSCNLAEIIMNDKGIEMLLLKKELQNKLSTLLEPGLPAEPELMSQGIKFVPGNVKLGYISLDNEDNGSECDGGSVKHHYDEDNDRPRKRLCVTRDTQTDPVANVPDITAEINFVVPTTSFNSHSYPSDNIYNKRPMNGLDNIVSVFKTDVSVNTMCSMSDSKSHMFYSDEPTSPRTCVKCCAELKKDYSVSTGSLPVIDGDPPAIQDIIITNCNETDREKRRRRRSLIKSRRVQTDVSLSNEDCSADELLRVSSQESLNGSFRKYSSQNSLPPVCEPVETRTFGTDPIDFGPELKSKSVNTTQAVKIVPDVRSVRTNTGKPEIRDSTTMTFPNNRTMDTQTTVKETVHKLVATDYAGQRNKRTSTPIIITTDNSTCMPSVTHENKVTWTEAVPTTERSICTENSEMVETSTETMKPILCDQGTFAQPEMKTTETNTPPVDIKTPSASAPSAASASSEGATAVKERKTKPKDKDKDKKEKTTDRKKKDKDKKERKERKKFSDCSVETDPVFTSEKETGTAMVQQKHSWTSTESPQLVNTGVSPARPATREACISTNPVAYMDQGTHTNVISLQDNTTETVNIICDSETLTERIGLHDAQTSVDVYSENAETITETCHITESGCMTDTTWPDDNDFERIVVCEMCQESRSYADKSTSPIAPETSNQGTMALSAEKHGKLIDCDTQTSEIEMFDKCIATSCDFEPDSDAFKKKLDYFDVSTSTENLPYIGLFSDMDCDELILVPDVALDVISSDLEYEKIRSDRFPVSVVEASAQTIVSAAALNVDILYDEETENCIDFDYLMGENLVTVGINTEHILTFEKETCTPTSHLFSKGTNTIDTTKVDKSTSTGSSVRAIQEMLGQSPVSDRSSKVLKSPKKDVSVATDNTLMDEKMIACINKLKNVSERLNSPTRKSANESPPWSKVSDVDSSNIDNTLFKDLDSISESERRKNVMELVAKSQAMLKSKDVKPDPGKRKAQPITTLKGKYPEKVAEQPKSVPPHAKHEPSVSYAVGSDSQNSVSEKRTPQSRRNNSAPGRIATVPNQAALRKSPKMSPKTQTKIPVQKAEKENALTLPAPKHEQGKQGPEFYSTVPKTRHSRQGLPIIAETRPMSVGSDSSNASYRSAVSGPAESTSSSDMTLDFSSLKIKAPPRAPSASPQPKRHVTKPRRETKSAPGAKTTMEVIPAPDLEPEARVRTGSSSSDQTDHEPHSEKKGFIKKLFGSKKKRSEKRTSSPSKSPKPVRKEISQDPPTPATPPAVNVEKPKEKPKPFVYMRGRIFSIEKEKKDEDQYSKPTVSKYCVPHDPDPPPPLFDFAATFTPKNTKKK